jgi:membrane protease YdiL (CAAX protease family)
MIVGLVWGLWHLPAFFINGLPQNQFSLPAFLLACVALSVLMTWVYQHTNGSILFAIFMHWLFNTDFLPRGTFPVVAALLTVAALVVVALTGVRLSRAPATEDPRGGTNPKVQTAS